MNSIKLTYSREFRRSWIIRATFLIISAALLTNCVASTFMSADALQSVQLLEETEHDVEKTEGNDLVKLHVPFADSDVALSSIAASLIFERMHQYQSICRDIPSPPPEVF